VSRSDPTDAIDATATADGWDRFVAEAASGSYLQTTAWARVKAANGWSARRIVAGPVHRLIGAQVLIRPLAPLPWGLAYAPRGPVVAEWSSGALADFTTQLRAELRGDPTRPAVVRIEPPLEAGARTDDDRSIEDVLRSLGWRRASPVQPPTTRIIDLGRPESDVWADMRGKWRQYVGHARRAGVTVVPGGEDDLGRLHQLLRETARRTGMRTRNEVSMRVLWAAIAARDDGRLLFAVDPAGQTLAGLLLVRCGDRFVELYGGMTADGGPTRANYLLKWEAIRQARDEGGASYDLWGVVNPGIAHFKAGFGGRLVEYAGAFDLPLARIGAPLVRFAIAMRDRLRRRGGASPDPGANP